MVFVNSMSDLFQAGVDDDYIEFCARVMVAAHWHTFQVLTKRSERMRELLQSRLKFAANCEHIWWGVSVENRKHGLPRIDHLQAARPGVAFLSIEPLLEDLGPLDLTHIHWVIVGGESGHGARPMHRDWVIDIRNQCRRAKVPFFFKQWGGVQKSRFGRALDGRTYDAMPGSHRRIPPPNREVRQQIIHELAERQQMALGEAAECNDRWEAEKCFARCMP
jgi:protein gp37